MRKLFLCVIAMVCALSASAEGGIGRAVERIPFRMPEEYSEETPVMFAVRTNLLVPALNIGAEVPIGDRWSVSADYYYPWIWPSKKNKNCFEFLGWSAEGRYWFGKDRTAKDRLLGHSAGLYGAGGYYDFERNYRGQQGEFVSVGLDYTYAMPIGRKRKMNLEFTFALGYIHSWGRAYKVHGDYGPLFKDEGDIRFDYVGPTKVAVNLVVPFTGGVLNETVQNHIPRPFVDHSCFFLPA